MSGGGGRPALPRWVGIVLKSNMAPVTSMSKGGAVKLLEHHLETRLELVPLFHKNKNKRGRVLRPGSIYEYIVPDRKEKVLVLPRKTAETMGLV